MSISAAAVLCLSSVIYHEARGEPREGQIAVASVVLNRVEDPRFPNTVCGVVKQKKQFSWYPHKPMTSKKETLARGILEGEVKRNEPKALFFTHVSMWFKKRVTAVIGKHRFYR